MANNSYPYNLPVSFHFKVDFGPGYDHDVMFQEVGGLTAEIGIEELAAGGENLFTYRLPTRAKYSNLLLKRGMILDSKLIDWFKNAVENFQFTPMNISVYLLNEQHNAISSWEVIQAYPVKWVISDFNATSNSLAIETIELVYQYFQRKKT
jgi:phage tail-like protein